MNFSLLNCIEYGYRNYILKTGNFKQVCEGFNFPTKEKLNNHKEKE